MYQFIRGGYLAVTTFFVLSGFVLSRGYARTQWTGGNLLRYGWARVARIYPVYLLSLAVIAPFVLADHTPGKVSYAGAYALLLQGWLGSIPVNWNTPAWTLSWRNVLLRGVPAGGPPHPARQLAQHAGRGRRRLLSHAGSLDSGRSRRSQALIHLADFVMGIAAACVFDLISRRARRPVGMWLYLPGCALAAALIAWLKPLPPGVDLNTALRPLNAVLLIGLALGGGFPRGARFLRAWPCI